ncbi:MAG: chromate transporter [Acidobacteria bacterium]|nr:chromate transporter [Acidobacteriota bacterium]
MRPYSNGAVAWLFFRLGNTTFGGGDPAMAALQRELVERRGWLTAEQHGLAYGLARVTPGTNILAYCAATGWMLTGWLGSLLAVSGVVIPSALLAVWLCGAYNAFGANPWFRAAIGGVVAGAVGMMASSGVSIIYGRTTGRWLIPGLAFAAAAVAAMWLGLLSPLKILILAGGLGALYGDAPRAKGDA